MQHLEGYKTNLWATPRQIAEIGGEIPDDCPKATIFIEKKSKAGNTFYSSYKLVNLDEVSFPDPSKLSDSAYKQIMDAYAIQEEYELPPATSFKPDYTSMRRKAPTTSKKVSDAISLPNVPKPRSGKVRMSNVPSVRHPYDYVKEGRPANVKLDLNEFDIHLEARTSDELHLMLERTLKVYVETKKALACL